MAGLFDLASLRIPTKRRAFFSFHYGDIMRVNNVRNAWKITHPDSAQNRSFQDSSLWESKKLTDPEQIKHLIRQGVDYTSAVCVLVGSDTWRRPWVRYEIARSVIDGRGLLAVHINGINHHQPPYGPHPMGENPIRYMGIARKQNGNLYLCERVKQGDAWSWRWYPEHTTAIPLPKYARTPEQGHPIRLSEITTEYDFARQNGHKNIGGWIDLAAVEAGR